jgi:hypothetical protein
MVQVHCVNREFTQGNDGPFRVEGLDDQVLVNPLEFIVEKFAVRLRGQRTEPNSFGSQFDPDRGVRLFCSLRGCISEMM